jgi:peptidoglycan/LPS O-acetylase OafA/YrhL
MVTRAVILTAMRVAVPDAIRRSAGTRPRRWLLALTLLAGLVAAVALTASLPPAQRTFATTTNPVQSLMSVTVPLLGILLVADLRRTSSNSVFPTLLGAVVVAAVIGLAGAGFCAAALAFAPSSDPWWHAVAIAAGGVPVQVLAVLVGTGLGMLLPSRLVAFLGTIVVPLGLWFVLRGTDAQAWLTPFAAVQNLLSGRMTAVMWAQWLVVFLVWGVCLNVAGAARLRR